MGSTKEIFDFLNSQENDCEIKIYDDLNNVLFIKTGSDKKSGAEILITRLKLNEESFYISFKENIYPSPFNIFGKNTILFTLFILIIALLSSFFLTTSLSIPLKRIKENIKKATYGEFNAQNPNTVEDDLIGNIEKAVIMMNENIKTAFEKEEEKNSLISHELKSPISNINLIAEVLQSPADEKNKNDFLKLLKSECKKLNVYINFIYLENSFKNEISVIKKKTIYIRELIKESIFTSNNFFNESKKIKVFYQSNRFLKINTSYEILYFILVNLLNNAQKYSKKNSDITVKVYSKDENLKIEITNIMKNDKKISEDTLFSKNYKEEKSEGLGLGLYIAKKCSTAINAVLQIKYKDKNRFSIEIKLNNNG